MSKTRNRQEQRTEVANAYACYLWEELRQYEKAVATWAEHVLPFATALYWNEFVRRLDQVGGMNDKRIGGSDVRAV
jgi:hypothetical protein